VGQAKTGRVAASSCAAAIAAIKTRRMAPSGFGVGGLRHQSRARY
jgi:hypothetical protein